MTAPLLSICFATYGQPKMLAKWIECFMEQPCEDRERTEVVVVDDCGTPPAEVIDGMKLLRVTKDVPWNQPGARNLAVMEASARVVLLIDPDMTLPPGMLTKFVVRAAAAKKGFVLKPLLRRITDEKFDASSPNVHFMLREDFLAVKGYDLRYCGRKGWSDVTMLHLLSLAYKIRRVDDLWLWLHHGDKSIIDAQVTTLDRNHSANRKLHIRHRDELRRMGWKKWVEEQHSPMMDFAWSRLR